MLSTNVIPTFASKLTHLEQPQYTKEQPKQPLVMMTRYFSCLTIATMAAVVSAENADVVDGANHVAHDAGSLAKDVAHDISHETRPAVDKAGSWIDGAIDTVAGAATNASHATGNWADSSVDSVSSAGGAAVDHADKALDSAASGLSSTADKVANTVDEAASEADEMASAAGDKIKSTSVASFCTVSVAGVVAVVVGLIANIM